MKCFGRTKIAKAIFVGIIILGLVGTQSTFSGIPIYDPVQPLSQVD